MVRARLGADHLEVRMVNVYVHLAVPGMPFDALEDDEFLERLWKELPDAAVGGELGGCVGITLSQFSVSAAAAGRRQARRVRDALAALGYGPMDVAVDETVREDWRDDVSAVIASLDWFARTIARRLSRR